MSDVGGSDKQVLDLNDEDVKALLADLPPEQRAKLEAYMKAHPDGDGEVPKAQATGELKIWRDDGDLIGVTFDREDIWLLLHALERVQEEGAFEEPSQSDKYNDLVHRVFEAYRD